MKPKIIQVTAIGMSQVKLLSKLNDELRYQGYDVQIMCTHDEYMGALLDKGFKLHNVKIDRSIHPFKNFKTLVNMYRIFKRESPDIVHVHTPVAGVLGRIAAKLAGVPNIIYTAHGFYFHEGMSKNAYKLFYNIEKYVGRFFTDFIFTQSEEDFETAINGRFLKHDNYLHISNGVDIENKFNIENYNQTSIQELKNQLDINEKDVVFSFLGRLVVEKGIFELLEAFEEVNKLYPSTKLLVMGDTPSSERDKSSSEKLQKYKNINSVIFLGQVSNPEDFYAISDVFILPSYREGMPRSIIEAMAMRNAVIATNIRGSREEVNHDNTGYLVDVKNPKQIFSSMVRLIEEPDRIVEFKKNGYIKAIENYNEEMVVEKQLQIFDKLTGR